MLKKDLAGFFAFFLGIFGVHRFYLGQWWRGAAQFVGFWAIIAMLAETGGEMPLPFILVGFVLAPLITAIVFWSTPYERWAAKYDPQALAAPGYVLSSLDHPSWKRQRGQQRPSLEALKQEGVKYYQSSDYDLATEAFLEASELAPTDPVVQFNLGCCYALLGQYAKALRALEVAVTHQLPRPDRIESHPALKELRTSAAYAQFRSNNYRLLNLVTPPATDDLLQADPVGEDEVPPDLLAQINQLRELHDSGILTQREYRTQREKLLG
ncbi:hypothetical protein LEM8419_00843 [Neolewinella maritima]|uniref:NINE protein n=1 Tax=Neolewinella maritima TaxID=1383882 RepID=A0ABN8F4Z3_9BACT|nr:NINE protein [Neolewinella maritima]CAH0999543.1 hypothetical protein LEM8419_00843 [Neolewinella maritima]